MENSTLVYSVNTEDPTQSSIRFQSLVVNSSQVSNSSVRYSSNSNVLYSSGSSVLNSVK